MSSSIKANDKNCPACGKKGRIVDSSTLKGLLSVSLRQVHDDVTYRFCATSDCDVVYYVQGDDQYFTVEQVRVPVYQKKSNSENVPICYCFQYSTEQIRQEIYQTGGTNAVEDINTGIQAGQCACDWRNPQGNCCLGNVQQFVKSVEEELKKINKT